MTKKVSCIICAYNEAGRIGSVLAALKDHPLVSEVVVVDDGSTDGTAKVVRSFGFPRLVKHAENRGKSAAFLTAVTNAQSDIIFCLDADLDGITPENITSLIEPVLSGEADIAMSFHRNNVFYTHLLGFNHITGDRVFSRDLIKDNLSEIPRLTRWGIEVFLNRLIIEKKLRVMSVFWKNVRNPPKTEKETVPNGIATLFSMVLDILTVVPLHKVIEQNIKLLGQTVRKPPERRLINFKL